MGRKITILHTALIVIGLIAVATVLLSLATNSRIGAAKRGIQGGRMNLKTYTTSELSLFNGINPALPIYLALDGYVYDVSKGREYYQIGGPYHDLAGRDASRELHLVGGAIIKRKYPVVGRTQ